MLPTLLSLASLSALPFGAPQLECFEGNPALRYTYIGSACSSRVRMRLESFIVHRGSEQRIDIGLAFEGGEKLTCDNPRGMPEVAILPLPIPEGDWSIFITDEFAGNLNLGKECEVHKVIHP
jgi:hypothetical protein